MIKTLTLLLALVLTTAAQAQKIDSTQFVAFYNYTIQTQDEEGQDVSDSIRVVLLIGTRATYYTTLLAYNNDGRVLQEQQNAFTMHHQNVLTDVEKNEVTAAPQANSMAKNGRLGFPRTYPHLPVHGNCADCRD